MEACRPGLVSVIIPVRNRPVLLAEAVASVLAQTYRPIEAIIVDDGSTDDTATVGRALAAAHPAEVRFFQAAGVGVAEARNAGLSVASGEFFQFLDSDDLVMPEKFARQVLGLRDHPECGISYCRTREYRLGGEWSGLPARRTAETVAQLFPYLLTGRIWAAPSPLYRRDVVVANGPFRNLAIYEDWDYEGRAASRRVALHHCDVYLADKRDAHHLTGGRKGGVQPHQFADYARVHVLMHGYARGARCGTGDLDRYARKLFAAAILCAAGGHEADARELIGLAICCARAWRRAPLAVYARLSDSMGWPRVGGWALWTAGSAPVVVARAAWRWPTGCYHRWQHRASEARQTVSGRSLATWPQLLSERWTHRRSRMRESR